MTTTHEAGTRVRSGYYFSGRTWTLLPVRHDAAVLPGTAGERFVRVPLPLALAVAPLMGAAFVVFLPLIGLYLAAHAAIGPVAAACARFATALAATLLPGWHPGEAHLTGQRAAAGAAPEPEHDPLVDLELEIAALREARARQG